MKKLLILILILFPTFAFAEFEEEDGFIIYKRPLLPGFSLNQTESTTELIYRGEVIKSYKNEEFAIELLPHGPNEEPDCYNSFSKDTNSKRLKTLIGMDYLKDCLILRSDKISNDYLLLYSPSIEGNRVSLYDIKAKKYYHWLINTVLSYKKHRKGGLVLFSRSTQNICTKSISVFYEGKLTKITDSCKISKNGIPVEISSFRIIGNVLEILYFDVSRVGNDFVTSKIQNKKRISLTGEAFQTKVVPKNTPAIVPKISVVNP